MLTILAIVLLIILLGGGGGYYAHGRYGGAGLGGVLASCSWFCSSFGWSGSSRAPSGPPQLSRGWAEPKWASAIRPCLARKLPDRRFLEVLARSLDRMMGELLTDASRHPQRVRRARAATPEEGSRAWRGFCRRQQLFAGCDFNLAARRPA